MTATGLSGAAHDLRIQEPWNVVQPSPFRQRLSRFGFRARKKSEGVIQGRLRIRSLPGAFLILGMLVVIVGTAVAVAGYWPYRAHRAASLGLAGGEGARPNASRVSVGRGPGARAILSTPGLVHNDRMKLLGPIIMGVGLFVFICANTMLYENRDRETQLLLAQAAVSAAVPCEDSLGPDNLLRPCSWSGNPAPTDLNILCLEESGDTECSLLQKEAGEVSWTDGSHSLHNTLLTKALHHQESSSPPISLHSVHSNSCNSSEVNFNMLTVSPKAGPQAIGSTGALALPLIKLNNCLMEASQASSRDGGWDAHVLPRRAYSLSSRTNPRGQQGERTEAGAKPQELADRLTFLPEPLRKEFSSDVCLNTVGLASWAPSSEEADLEEQKHRSWPRLDLSNARRFLKLESKEGSADKLLDKMDQQSSPSDMGFGLEPCQ